MDGFFDLAVRDFFAFGAFSSALTAAAEGTPDFVAELSAYDPEVKGSWLLLAS